MFTIAEFLMMWVHRDGLTQLNLQGNTCSIKDNMQGPEEMAATHLECMIE